MISFKVSDKKLKTERREQTFHFAKAVYNSVSTIKSLKRHITLKNMTSILDIFGKLIKFIIYLIKLINVIEGLIN